jgi:hypothetical protein
MGRSLGVVRLPLTGKKRKYLSYFEKERG